MLSKGTQVLYIPDHAEGKKDHQDVEPGFVMSNTIIDDVIFCRYWYPNLPRRLRTTSCSELTPIRCLVTHDTVLQQRVEDLIKELESE